MINVMMIFGTRPEAIKFAPTDISKNNLLREGKNPDTILLQVISRKH